MLFSTVLQLVLAAVVSAAPTVVKRQTISSGLTESKPFALYVESSNATLNGSLLQAAHAGAAIESLTVTTNKTFSNTPGTVFNFNTSSSFYTPNATVTGEPGYLVWTLHGYNFNESEPLSFVYSPFYDDALLYFQPSAGSEFWFKDDRLIDVLFTGNATNPVEVIDRFYACQTAYLQGGGYDYFSIHWKLGSGTPDNKSCQKVSIKRKFI